MVKSIRLTIVAGAACLVAGCERPAPPTDSIPPTITVIVSSVRGRNIFRSTDGFRVGGENCIRVPDKRTQLILIAGDAGGLQSVLLSASGSGVIIPDSIEATPPPPEGTLDARAEGMSITLTPPSPTTVRTGATAILEVEGTLPFGIIGWARDHSGNSANFDPFYLVSTADTETPCRN